MNVKHKVESDGANDGSPILQSKTKSSASRDHQTHSLIPLRASESSLYSFLRDLEKLSGYEGTLDKRRTSLPGWREYQAQLFRLRNRIFRDTLVLIAETNESLGVSQISRGAVSENNKGTAHYQRISTYPEDIPGFVPLDIF